MPRGTISPGIDFWCWLKIEERIELKGVNHAYHQGGILISDPPFDDEDIVLRVSDLPSQFPIY